LSTSTRTGSVTTARTGTSRRTSVRSANTGGVGPATSGRPSPFHTDSSTSAGTVMAVSFSQYWNACTNVALRMPPPATLTVTTTATTTAPTQTGAPVVERSARPAPCSWGTRYSQPIRTTSTLAMRRTARDPSRSSAKSGTV
jgi:hypothetical protein